MGKGIVIGLDKIIKKLDELPKDIQRDVDRVLAEGANDVVNLQRQLAPVDEGKLKGSNTAARLDIAAYEITNNVFYAPFIEFGTGKKVQVPPGYESMAAEAKSLPKRGNFNEFVENLARWMHNKGVGRGERKKGSRKKYAKQDLNAARWLAIKILKEGIKPQPFFIKSWEAYKPKILADVENVVTKKR